MQWLSTLAMWWELRRNFLKRLTLGSHLIPIRISESARVEFSHQDVFKLLNLMPTLVFLTLVFRDTLWEIESHVKNETKTNKKIQILDPILYTESFS